MRQCFALVTVVFAACATNAPGPTGDPPPAETPRELFDSTVAPLLAAKCSGCHVAPDAVAFDYESLVTNPVLNGGFDPAQAKLVAPVQAHPMIAFTPAEITVIDAWLLAEAAAR